MLDLVLSLPDLLHSDVTSQYILSWWFFIQHTRAGLKGMSVLMQVFLPFWSQLLVVRKGVTSLLL